MTDQQIRAAILETAYNATKKAGSIIAGIFNVYEVSKDWGEQKEKIDFNAEYLVEKGWVKYETEDGDMRITIEGIDEYEKKHKKE